MWLPNGAITRCTSRGVTNRSASGGRRCAAGYPPRRSFGGELGLSKMKRRKRRRYASSNEEHSFNFNREPAMFEEDGSMIAWCFIHCCWEEWRQVINDD